jgi:gluconokinase
MYDAAVGLDLGTSSLKVSMYSLDEGKFVDNFTVQYSVPMRAEAIAPLSRYVRATIEAVNQASSKATVKSIALSTQMYSFIVEEADGEELVYQWNLPWERSAEIDEILADHVNRSGCQPDTIFPSYKILSLNSRLGFPGHIRPFGLQEALIRELTGTLAGDYCCLSSYGFLDVRTGHWNKELQELAKLDTDSLPRIVRHNVPVGELSIGGLSQKTPILLAPGMGDGPSASYATTDVSPILSNVGTAFSARSTAGKEKIDQMNFPDAKNYYYMLREDLWLVGGLSSNGCNVLNAWKDLGFPRSYEEVDVVEDGKDIVYFPWKAGERAPFWSSSLRESLTGGGFTSTDRDYGAAIVRGTAFALAAVYFEVMKAGFDTSSPIVLAGGGAKNPALMDALRAVLPAPLYVLDQFDFLGSQGAAYSAVEALGENVHRDHSITEVVEPNGLLKESYSAWKSAADKAAANAG